MASRWSNVPAFLPQKTLSTMTPLLRRSLIGNHGLSRSRYEGTSKTLIRKYPKLIDPKDCLRCILPRYGWLHISGCLAINLSSRFRRWNALLWKLLGGGDDNQLSGETPKNAAADSCFRCNSTYTSLATGPPTLRSLGVRHVCDSHW